MIWHSSDAQSVLNELEVDDKSGLANGVADMRLEETGENIVSKVEKPSLLFRFLEQLNNTTVIALIIISIASFAVSLVYDEVNSYSPLLHS